MVSTLTAGWDLGGELAVGQETTEEAGTAVWGVGPELWFWGGLKGAEEEEETRRFLLNPTRPVR